MPALRDALAAILATLTAAGCASDRSTSLPPVPTPEPVAAPITPENAPVTDVIVLTTNGLQDLDGTGVSTQLVFAAYLYSKPFPAPKWMDGTILLEVYPVTTLKARAVPEGPRLAKWTWDTTTASDIRDQNLVGDFYSFVVDLSSKGIETRGVPGFNFTVSFTPAGGGEPVRSSLKSIWNQ